MTFIVITARNLPAESIRPDGPFNCQIDKNRKAQSTIGSNRSQSIRDVHARTGCRTEIFHDKFACRFGRLSFVNEFFFFLINSNDIRTPKMIVCYVSLEVWVECECDGRRIPSNRKFQLFVCNAKRPTGVRKTCGLWVYSFVAIYIDRYHILSDNYITLLWAVIQSSDSSPRGEWTRSRNPMWATTTGIRKTDFPVELLQGNCASSTPTGWTVTQQKTETAGPSLISSVVRDSTMISLFCVAAVCATVQARDTCRHCACLFFNSSSLFRTSIFFIFLFIFSHSLFLFQLINNNIGWMQS